MVLDPQRWLELRRFRGLLESGAMSLSEIYRETGLDRKTVRKYLSAPGSATPPRRSPSGRSRARVIDEFGPLIDSMLRAEILMKAAVIHERLAQEYGFTRELSAGQALRSDGPAEDRRGTRDHAHGVGGDAPPVRGDPRGPSASGLGR